MANFFIRFINYLIAGIGEVFSWAIALLPDSPFSVPASPPGSINLGWLSWFIPFPTMIAHVILLVTAIGIYYAIRVVMRWVKVARG